LRKAVASTHGLPVEAGGALPVPGLTDVTCAGIGFWETPGVMPRLLSTLVLGVGLALSFGGGASAELDTHSGAEAADVYTCPMHPEVTDTKPSRCPKCKMKLVPR
jgi:Heavy metal binding domain